MLGYFCKKYLRLNARGLSYIKLWNLRARSLRLK